jgi:hypothetical protein
MEYNGERVKLTKGDDAKLVDPGSALFDALKAEGWESPIVVSDAPEKRRGRPPKEAIEAEKEPE